VNERISIHSKWGNRVLEVLAIQRMDAEEGLEEYFETAGEGQ